MLNRKEERSALGWVIIPLIVAFLIIFGIQFLGPYFRHGFNAQIFYLTARAKEGAWTASAVSGYNYFWKTFQPVDEIVVQKGRPVVLRVTSSDVLHSFAIPSLREFRRPVDIEPGKFHEFVFTPEEEGTLMYLCWQVCSPEHGKMKGKIYVE